MKLSELNAADYNPRKDLKPSDPEYKKLKRSIQEFGLVEPVIWNSQTNNIVGGHQRLKVLLEMGVDEADVAVIDCSPKDEKLLNVILNRVKGRWDNEKLADIMQELSDAGELEFTGFDQWELQCLLMQYDHITDLLENDFATREEQTEKSTFTITFCLPEGSREAVEGYIKNTKNGKRELAAAVINKVKGVQ